MSLTIIDRIVSVFPLYGIDCICCTGMTIPVIFFSCNSEESKVDKSSQEPVQI